MQSAKETLRDAKRRERREFVRAHTGEVGQSIADLFMASPAAAGVSAGAVVAGYWPLADEADVRPLLERLRTGGAVCTLPVVTGAGEPLVFREWIPGTALDRGALGTRHPPEQMAERIPDLVLVPLLAFDRRGWRLGQGGGYYDRTLGGLRRRGSVRVVGIAFSCQEVEAVPHGAQDERLDWVVTEKEVIKAVME